MKEFTYGLAWAGLMLAVALGASYARQLGYIDAETVTRIVIALIGLYVAWFGNRMPKAVVPNAYARQATRVAGWTFVLSGLTYAGLFAFAPLPVATVGGVAAIIAGIAVTLVYCLWLRGKAKQTT